MTGPRRPPSNFRFNLRRAGWCRAAALACLFILIAPTLSSLQALTPTPGEISPLTDQVVDQRVNSLLKQMTLEEKIGQLTQIGQYVEDTLKPEERIRKGEVGSVLWLSDTAAINRLQHVAVEESRLHIPLLFGLDVINGFHTIFPVPLAMAASWDPAMVVQEQTLAAREANAAGIRWTFAPMVDIARDPRWGRIVEGAGEDPFLGAAMARAQVRGFQGPYVGSPEHLLACAKHFAGYGAADGGRDYDSAYVSEDALRNVYLPPFHAAVEAGAATLMSAYMDLNDVPATGNKFLLQEVLRHDWGFRGFVVSDAEAVKSLVTHGFARDPQDAAFRALTAGVNMDMASRTYLAHLGQLVKNGSITRAQIEDMVRPILAAKIRLGLFEHPYTDESRVQQILQAPEQQEFALHAAQRTMVLLRNENQILPLSTNVSSIAVIGPLADSASDLLGSWGAWVGEAKGVKTVLQAIRDKVPPSVRVEYAKGPDIKRDIPAIFEDIIPGVKHQAQTPAEADMQFTKAVETAGHCDVAVMVLGELGSMSGEDASRSSLILSGGQQKLLEAVVVLGKPVVLVLVSGRPLDISWASQQVPAILEAWYPGAQGGNAIADILFGDANPGGKLPVSWPRSTGQVPIYYAHNLTHRPETDKDFKSRYWDLRTSPLYPFGFGLSYAKFAFSNLQLSRTEMGLGDNMGVSVDVQNTGSRAGDEVVQLYIHQQAGSASRPVRELKGFERVSLQPGEKKTVHLTLGKNELIFWSPDEKKWVEEPENFDVWVGEDSTAALHANFKIRK
jgi:beta-glucosidase